MAERGAILVRLLTISNNFCRLLALLLGLICCANCGVAESARAATGDIRCYTAEPGDNFAMIARRVGYDAELLAAMNNLSVGYCCRGGEILRLPGDHASALTARSNYSADLRPSTGGQIWQAPLQGIITSAFASGRGESRHHGLDIAADAGSEILAGHSGTVTEAGWKNSIYGYAVVIDHGNGWQTLYAHCSRVLVSTGQSVQQGQKIALVGSTGNSTGPHLHLEISKDGVYLNPRVYFGDLSV